MIKMIKNNITLFLTLIILYLKLQSLNGHKTKRTLIFPPTSPTRVQFIYGIGIPLEDLDVESLTTGYVLKAEYFLPTKAEEFRPTQLTPQDIGYFPNSKRDLLEHIEEGFTDTTENGSKESQLKTEVSQLSKYRWAVYESLEILLKRFSKRFLIFPPSLPTRYQFIAGFGIPAELPDYQSLITGYVVKAMYYLPSNATQLYIVNPSGNKIRGNYPYESSTKAVEFVARKITEIQDKKMFPHLRWTFYSVLHNFLERAGYDGEACVLRSICEIAAVPFHPSSGLMAELIHILMSPSSSYDILGKHKQNQFYKAELIGRRGEPCAIIFKECKVSILQKFTLIKDLINMFG